MSFVLPVPFNFGHAVFNLVVDGESFREASLGEGFLFLGCNGQCLRKWFTSDFGCNSCLLGLANNSCDDCLNHFHAFVLDVNGTVLVDSGGDSVTRKVASFQVASHVAGFAC